MQRDRWKARSNLGNATKALARNPNDPTLVAEVRRCRAEYRATALAEHLREDLHVVDEIDVWAEQVARSLAPFTPTEAAAIGRLAAALDARPVGEVAA